jgi:hypothetical protein
LKHRETRRWIPTILKNHVIALRYFFYFCFVAGFGVARQTRGIICSCSALETTPRYSTVIIRVLSMKKWNYRRRNAHRMGPRRHANNFNAPIKPVFAVDVNFFLFRANKKISPKAPEVANWAASISVYSSMFAKFAMPHGNTAGAARSPPLPLATPAVAAATSCLSIGENT